ncbi:MAG: MMPL family transporter, partial [Aldersonia sp.]|nr:MMPL family transporter [Aldersonia sp.]
LGATEANFQEGALGLFDGQPIVSFMPICLIGVVIGLAMDYQVFLVSRMREEYMHGMSAKEAVVAGFGHGARVVTAAAVIMMSVFAAFIAEPDSFIKAMGFALAAAVFFDAFVVRMVIIPSVMAFLGEKAWWLPKWLDRVLPNVDVEGAKLEERHPRQEREMAPAR